MLKRVLSVISGLSLLAGFVLLLGTAGSSDLELIEFNTVLVRGGIAAALMLGGFFGVKILSPDFFD